MTKNCLSVFCCLFLLLFFAPVPEALADTHTAIASGNASAAGTWDKGAAPVDGDAILINAAYNVTWDINTSAWVTGLAASTVSNGSLSLPTTVSSYLKLGGNLTITSPGQFLGATSGTPLSTAYVAQINCQGYYITGTGLIALYATQATSKFALLSGDEAAGQTELGLDRDITTDPLWVAGGEVYIANINPGATYDTEVARVIAAGGVSSDHIDLTAGLTNAKPAGSYVLLLYRNIRVWGTGASGCFYNCNNSGNVIQVQIIYNSNVAVMHSMVNGVFSGTIGYTCAATVNTVRQCVGMTYNGAVITSPTSVTMLYNRSQTAINTIVAGGTYNIQPYFGDYTSSWYTTTFINATATANNISGEYFDSCNFIGMGSTFSGASGILASNCVSQNIAVRDFSICNNVQSYNCVWGAPTENYGYNLVGHTAPRAISISKNHDGVAGGYKSWTLGGVTTNQNVTYPSAAGKTWAMQTVLESASDYGFYEQRYTIFPGETIRFRVWVRKTAAGMAELPCAQIIMQRADPLLYSGYAPLATATMTDSVDTWELLELQYELPLSTEHEQFVLLRVLGKNASGSVYSYIERVRTPALLNRGDYLN